MRKLLSLLLAFMVFSVHAEVGTQGSVKAAIDELNYALTVEWDQKDGEFYNKSMTKFQNQLKFIMDSGADQTQVMEMLVNSLPNKSIAQDVQQALELIKFSQLSGEESQKLLLSIVEKHQAEGAAWAGKVAIIALALIVVIVVSVAILIEYAKRNPADCSYHCNYDSQGTCTLYYSCN